MSSGNGGLGGLGLPGLSLHLAPGGLCPLAGGAETPLGIGVLSASKLWCKQRGLLARQLLVGFCLVLCLGDMTVGSQEPHLANVNRGLHSRHRC